MRILHIAPYYAPAFAYGGVVSALTGLATAQAALGHMVSVLTTDAYDLTGQRNANRREILEGVQVIRCPNLSGMLRARYNLSTPRGLRTAFRELAASAEVIHTHELRTVENLLALLTVRRGGQPVVLSAHGTLPYESGRGGFKRGWDRLFGRALLRRISRLAALTEAEAQDGRALWQACGVTFPGAAILPNGVNAAFFAARDAHMEALAAAFRERYGLGAGPVALFLGRLHERKGLQLLIPAFAAAGCDPARLVIAGPDSGMLAAAQALTAQHGLSGRVIFPGMLTGDDRMAALYAADVFALPAVGEGLSMAALEAMAVGLPLLLTPGCNLPDVQERGAGLLVERSVDALAAGLRTILNDLQRRAEMRQHGRAWAAESFMWPGIAERSIGIYGELIS